jgi:hypothetical protein
MLCVSNDLYKLNHVIDVLPKSKTQLVISLKLLFQIKVFGKTQSGNPIRGSSISKNC